MPLKKATKTSTVCKVSKKKTQNRKSHAEIDKLLQIFRRSRSEMYTSSAESNFSTMKRIKIWLRSTMTDNSRNKRMFADFIKTC